MKTWMKTNEQEKTNVRQPSVIHVLPTLGVGGAERVVCELVVGLSARGFQSKIVTTIAGGPFEEFCREHQIVVEKLIRRDRFGWSTTRDMLALFRRDRPTIVHTHLSGPDMWGRVAAGLAHVPLILSTEHNTSPGTGWMKQTFKKMIARHTDGIVAVSNEVKRLLVQRDGMTSSDVYVIPNGIDLSRILVRGGHGFRDVPRLICVGRLYPQKGHAILLKALATIPRPWQLWIIGDGPCASELRRLAEELQIASRIAWLGIRNDVPQLLTEADVFCFPSLWEGQGLAAIEAAAAGVPIIASDLPEIHDILSKNEITYVAPGIVEAWSQAIEEMLSDPFPAIQRAIRSAPVIQQRVSQEKMIEAYAELYRKLMKSRGLL